MKRRGSRKNGILKDASASTSHWRDWKRQKPHDTNKFRRVLSYASLNPAKLAMRLVKTSSDMCRELSKALVRESFANLSRLVDSTSALAMEFMHRAGYYQKRRKRIRRVRRSISSDYAVRREIDVQPDSDSDSEDEKFSFSGSQPSTDEAREVIFVSRQKIRRRHQSIRGARGGASDTEANRRVKRKRRLRRVIDAIVKPTFWIPQRLTYRAFRLLMPSEPNQYHPPSMSLFNIYGFRPTGLLEDIELLILTWIDEGYNMVVITAQEVLTRIDTVILSILLQRPLPQWPMPSRLGLEKEFVNTIQVAFNTLRNLTEPMIHLFYGGVDDRGFHDFVLSVGYPYEHFEVQTEDGHLLSMERIPRTDSRKVVYFQHGVLDTSYAWISSCSGSGASNCAFAAFNCGYDVFLGNFRGSRERKHINPGISVGDYWDFCLDDHAMLDIRSFVEKILSVKQQEGFDEKEIDITVVAHSLGGAASLLYIVESLRRQQSHHLTRMFLLSPAGYHKVIPTLCRVTGPILYYTLSNLASGVRFPNGLFIFIVSKLMQDLRNLPATRDLVSFLYTTLLIGGQVQNSAFALNQNFSFNLLLGGTSSRVFKQLWQIYRDGQFQLYDYGSKKNLQIYGTKTPPNLLEFYNLIDIPIDFLCGENDYLIPPQDVFVHFDTLRQHHPHLAKFVCMPIANHINFTYGQDDSIISYITEHLSEIN